MNFLTIFPVYCWSIKTARGCSAGENIDPLHFPQNVRLLSKAISERCVPVLSDRKAFGSVGPKTHGIVSRPRCRTRACRRSDGMHRGAAVSRCPIRSLREPLGSKPAMAIRRDQCRPPATGDREPRPFAVLAKPARRAAGSRMHRPASGNADRATVAGRHV